ncbi:MAG: hypothetical protein JWM14_2170, partial [Chitinophagaceae bacterium]|nr:hypothetical protein [Chitinophagaceae bacterium]
NACGTSAASSTTITVNSATVPQPGAFTTSTANICAPQTGVVYTVPNVGGTTYNWSYSGTGFTITSSTNTNTITASFAAGSTSGTLSVTAQVGANVSAPRTLAITVGSVPTQPSTITPSIVSPCPNTTGVTYSVTSVAGVTYAWTYSGTGQTITAGNNTNAITVSYASGTSGSWTVTPSNTCGAGTAQTLAVTMGSSPTSAGAIGGTFTVLQGQSGVAYSVTNVGGTTYNWSYSGTGATINGTGNAITVDYSASATGGTLSVTATNACGTSPASTQVITVNPAGSTPQPGAFTASTATVCQGVSGVTYTVPSVAGTSYTWSYSGTGATINGVTSSITIDFSMTATGGNLSVVANNGSGNSIPRSMAITVNAMASQPGSIFGSATATQGQTNVAYFVPAQTGVTFAWSYTGTGLTVTSGQGTEGITVSYSSTATSGDIEVTASSSLCPSTSLPTSMTISISPSTGIEDGLDLDAYGLKVYPNPASSDVTVEINVKNVGSRLNLALYDVLGNEVRVLLDNASVISDSYTFSLEGLAYGVYIVRAKSGDDIKSIKLMKY